MASTILERRKDDLDARWGKRRAMNWGHAVTIGTRPDMPGWLFGVCECGQHADASVPGVVEAWATWHHWQVRRWS